MALLTTTILLTIWFVSSLSLPSPDPDYKEALKMSLLFYEAQRSGKLPPTNRIPWRGDSAVFDRGQNGEDLTGGYYDANDMVKFGFTTAFAITMISWGVISHEGAYRHIGQYPHVLEAIKWATDYFVKCHVGTYELYGQVGDFKLDHEFWGRPEEMNMSRPAYKIDKTRPGSDVAAEIAAALASSSLVFKNVNKSYALGLLERAKVLFEFSVKYKGFYHESIPEAKNQYENEDYEDEIAWAAAWLYKATGRDKYKKFASAFLRENLLLKNNNNTNHLFWYNTKTYGILILLAQETKSKQLTQAVKAYCDDAVLNGTRTPKKLLYLGKQGTLPRAANVAFLCIQALDVEGLEKQKRVYLKFAKEQLNYMLGANGRSFVVGFGKNYPLKPFHAPSSCPDLPAKCSMEQFHSTGPNPQILYGALVSGPHENDFYQDRRDEHLYNEVTLDYNSGFQGALAGLTRHLDLIHGENRS